MPNVWNAQRSIRKFMWISLVGFVILGGCRKQAAKNPASKSEPSPAASTGTSGPPPAVETPAPPPPTPPTGPSNAMTPAPAQGAATAAGSPPPAAPVVYTVPRNTRVAVRISQTLNSKRNIVGDPFRGTLAESIRVKGVVVVRYGTPVSGVVVGSKGQGRLKGAGDLAIKLTRIGPNPVTSTVYEKTISGKGKRTAGFIGGGGGGGALLGALAGGGRGALIGGLVGAGAGTAGAAFTGNKEVVIPAEGLVSFSLISPLQISVPPPPKAGQ